MTSLKRPAPGAAFCLSGDPVRTRSLGGFRVRTGRLDWFAFYLALGIEKTVSWSGLPVKPGSWYVGIR